MGFQNPLCPKETHDSLPYSWKELQKLMGTKLLMSTAFYPQTDGATEQAYRSVAQILQTVVDNDQRNW